MNSSWKTTLCGLVALIGATLPQFFPELTQLGGFLAALGAGAGLLFARDHSHDHDAAAAALANLSVPISRKPEPPTPPTPATITTKRESSIPLLALTAGLAVFLTGCTATGFRMPDGTRFFTARLFWQGQIQSADLTSTNGAHVGLVGYKSEAAETAGAIAEGVARGLKPAP